jgi:hypothetical protein
MYVLEKHKALPDWMLSIAVVDCSFVTSHLPVIQYIKVKLNEYRQQGQYVSSDFM